MNEPNLSPIDKINWAKRRLQEAMEVQVSSPTGFNKQEENYWRVLYKGYVEEYNELQQRLMDALRKKGYIQD